MARILGLITRVIVTHTKGAVTVQAIRAATRVSMLARAVTAWGSPKRKSDERQFRLVKALVKQSLWTIGPFTKRGYPRRPLYLRSDTPFVEWRLTSDARQQNTQKRPKNEQQI